MKQYGFNAVRTSHAPNDPSSTTCATSSASTWSTRRTREPRVQLLAVRRPTLAGRGSTRHPHGDPGQEPPVDHHVVARQRDRLRRRARGARGLDPPLRPAPAAPLRGGGQWDWGRDQTATDVLCPMYPGIADIVDWAANRRGDPPLIMCEYIHAMDNSTARWRTIGMPSALPGLQGGFVWDWVDQACAAPADGTERLAYGGDFGDEPNDVNSASTASCGPTAARSRRCGSTACWRCPSVSNLWGSACGS